jgi:hypothetical protein
MTQANDRSILMLPKLRDNKVKRGTTGKWNRQAPAAFADVARSIDVVVAGDVANVNSIPSMWAHPLSLESILPSNDYNPRIRNPLVNQWRGMLAAIALAPDFESVGKFTAQAIDLSDSGYRTNNFIQSLLRLVPSDDKCLFELPKKLNPWLKGYIFRWNKKSIGMTSPSTIVCPSEDADWTGLPWFIDNEVQSPEEHLTPDQRSRLSRWLVHLRKKITEHGLGISEAIAALINSFIDDLGGDRETDLNTDENGNIIDLVKEEIYFGIPLDLGIYTAINHPLKDIIGGGNPFLPDLYFLRRPDAFPNADLPESIKSLSFGDLPISVILPVDSSFFNRSDAANLLSKLKVERLRSGTAVKVKLSMQADGLAHPYEKEYELKNENAISGLPIAEIWPNFVSPKWKVYYGYTLLDVDDTRLSFEFPNVINHLENTHKFERSQLSRFESFPNHIICWCDQKEVGTIPLRVPATIKDVSAKWDVGVDFGTSFTNAYKKQGETDEKLSFEDLHYRLTASDEGERLTVLTDNFIPPKQALPIASLLTVKDGKNQVRHNSDREAEILFDARIYILEAPRKVQDGKDYLISNLKWNNLNNQEPMRLFIEQFALQISAQAVKNGVTEIKWALSYPTAFSRRDKNSYANIWNTCSEKLSEITGLKYEELSLKGKNFRSESLAVAHYFASKKNKKLLNAACIDIGGGTSDISIWEAQKNEIVPVYQCSVQLAGKHLFSNIVKRDPEFLNHIKLANDDTLIRLQEEPTLFASAMDTLAKASSDSWLKNQRRKLQDDERLYGYLQILAIGVAGLHYYVGLVLQVLHSDEIESRRYQAGEPVDIYFGGNGCRLLNWLSDTGKFEGDEISDLFQEMVIKGSGFKPSAETSSVSDKPKEEAACGLVVGKKKLGDPTTAEDELIAGEPCKVGSHVFEWNSYIKFDADVVESIDELEVVRKPEELVNLPKFLYWFHKRLKAKRNIVLPAIRGFSLGDPKKTDEENLETTIQDNIKLWNQVVKELKNSLILEDGATTESIRLEPPFILALKALIEVLAEEWADK